MQLIRQHHISVKNALNGINWAIHTQPNFRVHAILSIIVIFCGIFLQVSNFEMAVLVLAIVFGFGAEMINTSIEAMTDLITSEYRQQAKIAKDVSAGMMLMIAFGTVVLALIIFLPRILAKLT